MEGLEVATARGPIVDIDHVMCKVDDIARGLRTLERLGFKPTPYSRLEMMGGGNSLVLLKARNPQIANFLEIAYSGEPPGPVPLMARILDEGEGVKMVVHMTDAAAAREAWTGLGLTVAPLIPFERVTRLPSGEELVFRATVAIPEPRQAPLMFNGYETATLELYRRPDYQEHPNTAVHWDAVTAVVEPGGFDEAVRFYERLYGGPARRGAGAALLCLGEVELRILTPERLAARYAGVPGLERFRPPAYVGLTVAVEDPAQLAAHLAASGIPATRIGASLCVAPEDALGILLEFVPTGAGEAI